MSKKIDDYVAEQQAVNLQLIEVLQNIKADVESLHKQIEDAVDSRDLAALQNVLNSAKSILAKADEIDALTKPAEGGQTTSGGQETTGDSTAEGTTAG